MLRTYQNVCLYDAQIGLDEHEQDIVLHETCPADHYHGVHAAQREN